LYARSGSGKQARLHRFIITRISSMTGLAFPARKNSHTIVRLLAKHQALIASLLKYIRGKLVVSALGLLHAKNVRLNGVEPARDAWQARQD
jgi:hypothetical protein